MSQSFRLVKPEALSQQEIASFFITAFGEKKGEFLSQHRAWHYHDSAAQYFVLAEDGTLAAFNALIQAQCLIGEIAHDCLWLVDIIVLPEFRGQGLQRLMDEAIRELGHVRLGFPNEVAAKIHRKHGWGVRQESTKLSLPLSMHVSDRVRLSPKLIGKISRAISSVLSPLYASFFRVQRGNYQPQATRCLPSPDFEQFASVYEDYQRPLATMTTHRDQAFLRWRYGNAPYDLQYYSVGDTDAPQLIIITRILEHKGIKTLRIMDIFGAIDKLTLVQDGIKTVLRDASHAQIEQIQVISSHAKLLDILRSLGFWLSQSIDFCWYTQDESLMAQIADTHSHWVFADSDFDAP